MAFHKGLLETVLNAVNLHTRVDKRGNTTVFIKSIKFILKGIVFSLGELSQDFKLVMADH